MTFLLCFSLVKYLLLLYWREELKQDNIGYTMYSLTLNCFVILLLLLNKVFSTLIKCVGVFVEDIK